MNIEQKNRLIALCDNMKSYGYTDGVEELESIFPQLRESEDERIRQWIVVELQESLHEIQLMYSGDYDGRDDEDRLREEYLKKAIAYLEKQKERHHEWSLQDEKNLDEIFCAIRLDSALSEKKQDELIRWLQQYRPYMQKEQKPVEPNDINVKKMIDTYRCTEEYDKDGNRKGTPILCMVRAYEQGIRDVLKIVKQKPADEAEKFFDSAESYNQGFVAGQKKMKEDIEKGFGIGEHSLDYLAGRYAGYEAAKQEQKPAEWSYPYGINETVDRLVSIAGCLEMDGDCLFNDYSGTECGKFLRDLARKEIECKPAEWSEEEKRKIVELKTFIAQCNGFNKANRQKAFNMIDALRPQPKPEWNEEDERIYQSIMDDTVQENQLDEKQINWLRDIKYRNFSRPKNTWKPSEEQMEALFSCFEESGRMAPDEEGLRSLYNDLEKYYNVHRY